MAGHRRAPQSGPGRRLRTDFCRYHRAKARRAGNSRGARHGRNRIARFAGGASEPGPRRRRWPRLGQLTAGIAREIKSPLNFVNNVAVLPVELLDELKQAAVQVMGKHPGRTLFCGHARRLGAQDRRMLGEEFFVPARGPSGLAAAFVARRQALSRSRPARRLFQRRQHSRIVARHQTDLTGA